jgi:tRNA pseudouridine38-40 synthase
MVRNIVGTLLDIGRGKLDLSALEQIFVRRDRRLAGFTAPAHGLFLVKVKY